MTALLVVAALLLGLVAYTRWIQRQVYLSHRTQVLEATDSAVSRYVLTAPSPDADRIRDYRAAVNRLVVKP